MPNIVVKRTQRQVEDPSGVIRQEVRATGAEGRALEAVGAGLQEVAGGISAIGGAVQRRLNIQARMKAEEDLNRATNAATEVQRDLIPTRARELETPGLDSIGNRKRFGESLEKSISEKTKDMSPELRALVRNNLNSFVLDSEGKLAVHEAQERRKVTASNIAQVKDIAVQNATNDPASLEQGIADVANTINQYRAVGAMGEEEAQDTLEDARTDMFVSAIQGEMLRDADQAQGLFDALKQGIPSDAQKTLQSDINKQAKLQKEEDEATRKDTVEDFQNSLITSAVDGEVPTETSVKLSPAWELMEPSERKSTLQILRDADPLKKSDPVIKADFTTKVNTAPETLTEQDFIDKHGNGLSTADFQTLVTKWRENIESEETPAQSGRKQAYKILDDAKTKRIYDSDDLENELAWASATQALDVFVEENPNATAEEYTDFVENLLIIPEKDFINRFFDFFSDDKGIRFRAEAIKALTEAGHPVTESNIANISDQIEAQRGE